MKAWALSTHILPGARHLAPCPARPHQSHPQRRPPSGLTSSPSAHPTARRRLLTSPLPLRSGHQPSLPATAGASPPASLSASVSPTVWPQYSPKPSQVTLLRTPHPRRRPAPSEPSSPKPSPTPDPTSLLLSSSPTLHSHLEGLAVPNRPATPLSASSPGNVSCKQAGVWLDAVPPASI